MPTQNEIKACLAARKDCGGYKFHDRDEYACGVTEMGACASYYVGGTKGQDPATHLPRPGETMTTTRAQQIEQAAMALLKNTKVYQSEAITDPALWRALGAALTLPVDELPTSTEERERLGLQAPPEPSGIRKFLDLSTAHLTPATLTAMDDDTIQFAPIYRHPEGHGYFVWVPDSMDSLSEPCVIPEDLKECLARARELGCDFINFDCDACDDEDLPEYDHETGELVTDELDAAEQAARDQAHPATEAQP